MRHAKAVAWPSSLREGMRRRVPIWNWLLTTDQPVLEISNSAIGKRNSRPRTFTEFRSQRLSPGDMFESSFRDTVEALEAISVDG